MLERLKYDKEMVAAELQKQVGDTDGREKVDALTGIATGAVILCNNKVSKCWFFVLPERLFIIQSIAELESGVIRKVWH